MLVCLTFHPTEDYIATGGNIGQIRLWYCLDPALMESASEGLEWRAKTATMPWHAHVVSSLSFSGNGAYLLSGGEEAVCGYLAEFVRAPISTISVASHQTSDEEYLLVLSDATIVSISSATVRIARSFARVKHDPKTWSSGPAPILFHTLASIEEDGNGKVWQVRTVSGKSGEKEVFWVCRSTQGRSQVPHCAACLPDGSLLAVAFGSTAVVYELSTNVQRLTLKTPQKRNISDVIFIGASGRVLLYRASGSRCVF
ncbi:hypothetical protein M422DRAFT_250036 [Sphaerobolus stellatus SS14]|nr:hypothetical protein M422DRAFT_250036 [Sphaerobolus stellatus SS14]